MLGSDETAVPLSLRVATIEVVTVTVAPAVDDHFACQITVLCKDGSRAMLSGTGQSETAAVADAIASLCVKPFTVTHCEWMTPSDAMFRCVIAVSENDSTGPRAGVGKCADPRREVALVIATLRAVSHAALLKAAYRANNQKVLRDWSGELMRELSETLGIESIAGMKRLEAEGIVLEHLNRVASAAILTAANHPKPDSILSLFDTSAWLFDSQGRRRDSYTDTNLWLAWYPGIANDHLTVDEVIDSLPAAPDSAIPWIVKLFENPESWLRFRGAVDLEDHDVMHVLLGRGLQDQDEAFVLGFAMGTAKRVSWVEVRIFKFVLARIYPEPYRVPAFLQPAFDLGLRCGQETGVRDLYRRPLKELRELTLGEARRQAGIDLRIVRKYYELEQQQIPFTIASLRLP